MQSKIHFLFSCAALLSAITFDSGSAAAQAISGLATAVDGDSLRVGTRPVRLFGIDAPELKQTCTKDDTAWRCGEAARDNLDALIAGQTVVCRGQGVDQYARLIAVCSAGGIELNEALVTYGWAVAYREYSSAYVPHELSAKTNRAGIWSSYFETPSSYRVAQLPALESSPPPQVKARSLKSASRAPTGCAIKGNRSRRGEWIYHLPGMPYYNQTRPEEMFCSEAEARAAGYRRSRAGH